MSEEHLKQIAALQPIAGKFSATVKFWMGPGEPFLSTGKMTNEWTLNERFLHQVFEGDPTPEGNANSQIPVFRGRGYWGYNAAEKCFETFWIDTASSKMMLEQGQLDLNTNTWTMSGEFQHPENGQTIKRRTTYQIVESENYQMQQFLRIGDQPEMQAMEIDFQKTE